MRKRVANCERCVYWPWCCGTRYDEDGFCEYYVRRGKRELLALVMVVVGAVLFLLFIGGMFAGIADAAQGRLEEATQAKAEAVALLEKTRAVRMELHGGALGR